MDADRVLEFEPGTAKFSDWAAKQNSLVYRVEFPNETLPPPQTEDSSLREARESKLRNPPPSNRGTREIVFAGAGEAQRVFDNSTEAFSVTCGVDYQLKNAKGPEAHGKDPGRVSLSPLYLGKHTDGWIVSGLIHDDDWFYAVGAFEARHPELGLVCGDFEKTVQASNAKAFFNFIESYPPIVWDAWDQ